MATAGQGYATRRSKGPKRVWGGVTVSDAVQVALQESGMCLYHVLLPVRPSLTGVSRLHWHADLQSYADHNGIIREGEQCVCMWQPLSITCQSCSC